MTTYRVSLRLNLKPDNAGAVIDTIAPGLKQVGLSFRNGAPGVIEGKGLSLTALGMIMSKLAELAESPQASGWLPESGLIDDMWLHVSAERGH
jgi:hypothetical protein